MPDAARQRALVWCDPEQTVLIRDAFARADIHAVTVGTATPGRAPDVAAALAWGGAEGGGGEPPRPADDLRAALLAFDGELALLAAPGAFGDGTDTADADALRAARSRGVVIASFEPLPLQPGALGGRAGLTAGSGGSPAADAPSAPGWAVAVPLLSMSKAMRTAAEALAAFPQPRTLAVECWAPAIMGSLAARAFDAFELVVRLLGSPDRIDAAFIDRARARGVHRVAGQSIAGLSGDLTANCRLADGRAASVVVSNAAPPWRRSLTLTGEAGRLRLAGRGWEWHDVAGSVSDSWTDDEGADEAGALADALSMLTDPGRAQAMVTPPTDHRRVLACVHAAFLSARTGEGESPATMLSMTGAS